MKIYTLTLNPAYDVHGECDDFAALRENFVSVTGRDAGGKGVNISRALQNAGVANTAVVVVGEENSEEFCDSLNRFGLDCIFLEKPGRIRENLTIHHGEVETRISFSGFAVDDSLLDEVFSLMELSTDTLVTFTGSIPKGITKAAAIAFLQKLKNNGVKLVLDCRSFELADIQAVKPWLIKPNQQEISQWFGAAVNTMDQAAMYAQKLYSMGVVNAMVSMGNQGAVLYSNGLWKAVTPELDPVSTIGAGDSSIAGFLCAVTHGSDKRECLRYAVAFGSAACLTEGTQPPQKAEIDKYLRNIKVLEGI
jgi:1-phosphofructokinase family hexose kinase